MQLGTKIYSYVAIEDMLGGLIAQTPVFSGRDDVSAPDILPLSGERSDILGSASFYPRLQRFLKSGDVLVIETGTCMLHLGPTWLPAGVGCETQTLWGSIGWATPAALGVTMANAEGRTIVVTGDGSHQLTLNELGVMGRYDTKPVIFVLNNGIYGVEDVLSERGHEYDNLARLNYHLLPEAMGCTGWLSRRVSTIGELEDVLSSISADNTGAYIEVMIPEDESQPLPGEIINRVYKFRTPAAT